MKLSQFRTLILSIFILFGTKIYSQSTKIQGFADISSVFEKKAVGSKQYFNLGDEDLFITSEINDRFSFLGETVFKYSNGSATSPPAWGVNVERMVMKYNYSGNHNILIGKHHSCVNYWGETYHHGRVFYPTVERPTIFPDFIIPLLTEGVSFQGSNFGKLKCGYNIMMGNGLGLGDENHNKSRSLTVAVHSKPIEHLNIGGSIYIDRMDGGVKLIGSNWTTKENMIYRVGSGHLAYFHHRIESLTEYSLAFNHYLTSKSTPKTKAFYSYLGIRLPSKKLDKLVAYGRIDLIKYDVNPDLFFVDTKHGILGGIRYEADANVVLKCEFQQLRHDNPPPKIPVLERKLFLQLSVGF